MLALMEQLGSRRFSRVLSSEVHGGQSGFNHVDEHWGIHRLSGMPTRSKISALSGRNSSLKKNSLI